MTTYSESSNHVAPRRTHSDTTATNTQQATRYEADRLKDHAETAASDLAETAQDEAYAVQDEAMSQAKSLGHTVQDEAAGQAANQQQKLAEQSRTVTNDLHRISRGERPQSDMVTRAAGSIAHGAESVTRHLETKEPGEILGDVRRFAARRPGAFLLIAAGAGLLAGRLTRGLRDANQQEQGQSLESTDQSVAPQAAVQPARGTGTFGTQPAVEHSRTDLGGQR